MVGFQGESPADRRVRWRAQLRGVSEMFKPCSRESERQKKREGASLARRFKQSVFWTSLKAAGPIRASVRGGAPPARLVFAKHFFM